MKKSFLRAHRILVRAKKSIKNNNDEKQKKKTKEMMKLGICPVFNKIVL